MKPAAVQKHGGGGGDGAAAAVAVEPAGWQRYWVVEWHAMGSEMQGHRAAGSQVIPVHLGGG